MISVYSLDWIYHILKLPYSLFVQLREQRRDKDFRVLDESVQIRRRRLGKVKMGSHIQSLLARLEYKDVYGRVLSQAGGYNKTSSTTTDDDEVKRP